MNCRRIFDSTNCFLRWKEHSYCCKLFVTFIVFCKIVVLIKKAVLPFALDMKNSKFPVGRSRRITFDDFDQNNYLRYIYIKLLSNLWKKVIHRNLDIKVIYRIRGRYLWFKSRNSSHVRNNLALSIGQPHIISRFLHVLLAWEYFTDCDF